MPVSECRDRHPLSSRKGVHASGHSDVVYRSPAQSMDPRSLEELLVKVKEGAVSPQEAAKHLAPSPTRTWASPRWTTTARCAAGSGDDLRRRQDPEQIAAIVERITAGASGSWSRDERRGAPEGGRDPARGSIPRDGPLPDCGDDAGPPCRGGSRSAPRDVGLVGGRGGGRHRELPRAAIERVYDVGVAGLHRLLDRAETIRQADVVIVVAGMEGALPPSAPPPPASDETRRRRRESPLHSGDDDDHVGLPDRLRPSRSRCSPATPTSYTRSMAAPWKLA